MPPRTLVIIAAGILIAGGGTIAYLTVSRGEEPQEAAPDELALDAERLLEGEIALDYPSDSNFYIAVSEDTTDLVYQTADRPEDWLLQALTNWENALNSESADQSAEYVDRLFNNTNHPWAQSLMVNADRAGSETHVDLNYEELIDVSFDGDQDRRLTFELIEFRNGQPRNRSMVELQLRPTESTKGVEWRIEDLATSRQSRDLLPVDESPGPMVNIWRFGGEAPGGYRFIGSLEVGEPVSLSDQPKFLDKAYDPELGSTETGLVAGSACPISEGSDALIPAYLSITNTTPAFPIDQLGVHLLFNRDWTGAAAEVGYADGPFCAEQPQGFSLISLEPADPWRGTGAFIFFVVRDFYSPNSPNGDQSLFENIGLEVRPIQPDAMITEVLGPGAHDAYIPLVP